MASEALADFAANPVVVRDAVGLQELNPRWAPFRIGHAGHDRCVARNWLARIQKIVQMPALGAVVPGLKGGRVADLTLDVEHVLHGVRGRQVVIGAPGKTDRKVDGQGRGVQKVGIGNVLGR